MYEFWYEYVKTKYRGKAKLCYMDKGSFIVFIKTEDIYSDIAEDVEIKFDSLNYELDRPFFKGKNKKVIRFIKDKLGGKIMKESAVLRSKTYSY